MSMSISKIKRIRMPKSIHPDGVLRREEANVYTQALLENLSVIRHSADESPKHWHPPLERVDLVIGDVPFVARALSHLGVAVPEPCYYPQALRSFLGRTVEPMRWQQAYERVQSQPTFIKSHAYKRLTGQVWTPCALPDHRLLSPDEPVWVSDPITLCAEYRIYIRAHQVVGASLYQTAPEVCEDDWEDPALALDWSVIHAALKAMAQQPETLSLSGHWVLDWGIKESGETVLVEANDAWAIGYYPWGLSRKEYLDLLASRWVEMMGLPGCVD